MLIWAFMCARMMLQLNSKVGGLLPSPFLTPLEVKDVEMFRINARIGKDSNDWLDAESERTGVPKSTLIHLAVEHYIQHKEAMKVMADMGQLVQAIEELGKKIDKSVQ